MDSNNNRVDYGILPIKPVKSIISEKFYDKRRFETDTKDGIATDGKGEEFFTLSRIRVPLLYNENVIAYMIVQSSGFDNPDLQSGLANGTRYNGNGFYLRADNFIEKMPIFAASRYIKYNPEWTERGRVMKSGDGAEKFSCDVASGLLNDFLARCLIFTCFEPQNHCRSLHGSDGRFYRNELCFDNIDGKTTIARDKLNELIKAGFVLNDDEKALMTKWNEVLEKVKHTDEYNPEFTYGLYQIDEEINVKIQRGTKRDGTPNMVIKYGDLNNLIKELKQMVKEYYLKYLVDTLFEYEFLK